MKFYNELIFYVLTGCLLTTCVANADVLIDFSDADGETAGYANVNNPGAGSTGLGSILTTTYDLTDFDTSSDTGWNLELSLVDANTNGGDSGSGANYTGSKPAALSSFAASALNDGLFAKNGTGFNLEFSGLNASAEYDFLIYSARGNGGGNAIFNFTAGTGTGGGISVVSSNDDEVVSITGTSTAGGLLTLTWTFTEGSNESALNFISMAQVVPAVIDLPIVPTGFTAVSGNARSVLSWDANTQIGFEAFRIKRSTSMGGPYTQIASTTNSVFGDLSISSGTTYYYVVTAVNTDSVESAASSEQSATPSPALTGKPNVIMIYYDDMGYSDMGAYDTSQTSLTPALDTFATQSLQFTAGHSSDAVCTPSRYSLMTGRYSWRTTLKESVTGGYSAPLMQSDRFTIGKMFQSLGYQTAMVGKWHVGMQFYSPTGQPVDLYNDSNVLDGDHATTSGDKIDFSKKLSNTPYHQGFDYFFGTSASLDMPPYLWIENDTVLSKGGFVTGGAVDFSQGVPASNADLSEGKPANASRSGVYDPNFVITDYMQVQAQKVSDLIAARATDGEPFYIYVPMPAPHTPWAIQPAFSNSATYTYGKYLAQTDHYTRIILDALADPDGNAATDDSLVDNTVVFISSDNGPEKSAQSASISAGRDSNGPFRGIKRDNWEGGTRVPFLIRWPGVVAPGTTTDHACWQGDFFATMAAYLGYDFNDDEAPDAESFLPVLLGGSMPEERREGFIQHSMWGQMAIVDKAGEWKLLDGTASGGYTLGTIFGDPKQLYNLLTDPGESNNLLAGTPTQAALEKEAELYALLNEIRGDTTYGTDGDSNVPLPGNAHSDTDALKDGDFDGSSTLLEQTLGSDPLARL